jgi:hypothetical protein
MTAPSRWAIDGKGEFSVADPAPRFGQEPELSDAPLLSTAVWRRQRRPWGRRRRTLPSGTR